MPKFDKTTATKISYTLEITMEEFIKAFMAYDIGKDAIVTIATPGGPSWSGSLSHIHSTSKFIITWNETEISIPVVLV